MHVAFATSAAHPGLTADDRLAVDACETQGIRVSAAVWDDPAVTWSAYDAVIIRSTWDYHRRSATFDEWLTRLETSGTRVWNPVPLLRWNADKHYLADLAERGITTVPTAWLSRTEAQTLGDLMDRRGWSDVVIKPTVSATAYGTHRVGRDGADAIVEAMPALPVALRFLVQPFLPEIETAGEWSLIFFNGRFSHSVRKRPIPGDFRVQTEYGGSSAAERAPDAVIARATTVLEAVDEPWLYARVDGIETATGFLLMELEMLEPSLFFALDPESPARFAAALAALQAV